MRRNGKGHLGKRCVGERMKKRCWYEVQNMGRILVVVSVKGMRCS